VVVSPAISAKMNSQILNFVLVNIMKSLGSRCIPFQVYTRFVAYLVVICTLHACYLGDALPGLSSRAGHRQI